MRVFGIDCGTEYTGFGVVELAPSGRLVCLTCGAIKVSPRESMPARLNRIYVRLDALIHEHQPDRLPLESKSIEPPRWQQVKTWSSSAG